MCRRTCTIGSFPRPDHRPTRSRPDRRDRQPTRAPRPRPRPRESRPRDRRARARRHRGAAASGRIHQSQPGGRAGPAIDRWARRVGCRAVCLRRRAGRIVDQRRALERFPRAGGLAFGHRGRPAAVIFGLANVGVSVHRRRPDTDPARPRDAQHPGRADERAGPHSGTDAAADVPTDGAADPRTDTAPDDPTYGPTGSAAHRDTDPGANGAAAHAQADAGRDGATNGPADRAAHAAAHAQADAGRDPAARSPRGQGSPAVPHQARDPAGPRQGGWGLGTTLFEQARRRGQGQRS